MSEQARCPACGAFAGFRRSRSRGLWEKTLARIGRLKAYRCDACQRRILRRWLPGVEEEASGPPGSEARAQAPFASKQPTDDFDELIREISATERSYTSQEPGRR